MGIPPSFVPDHLDSFLSYTVVNYLKKVKQQVRIREKMVDIIITVMIVSAFLN